MTFYLTTHIWWTFSFFFLIIGCYKSVGTGTLFYRVKKFYLVSEIIYLLKSCGNNANTFHRRFAQLPLMFTYFMLHNAMISTGSWGQYDSTIDCYTDCVQILSVFWSRVQWVLCCIWLSCHSLFQSGAVPQSVSVFCDIDTSEE